MSLLYFVSSVFYFHICFILLLRDPIFLTKQSLVAEIKDKESNPVSEFDLENTSRRQIIDTNPTAIIMTTTIQPK
jgi:hypothetical protein